ncbi:hypothetical protein [Salinigranum marinum]|uniref:hypothetical protein n=1 Tax=Salinigranum marinum TaxID=1515595 RepID=UPI002989ACE7|nr:hypothetical protein [Salinigranum marinum]
MLKNTRHSVATVLVVLAVSALLVASLTAFAGTTIAQSTTDIKAGTAMTATNNPSESGPVRFNQPPSVDLQTRELTVTQNTPGTVSLFVRNPAVNERTMIVDAQMGVGPGVYMVGSRLASGSGAGTVAATYEIPPGTSRTIELDIYPTEVRDMTVDGTVTYWPEGNREAYNILNPSFQFTVRGVPSPPDNPSGDRTVIGTGAVSGDTGGGGNGGWPPQSLILYIGVAGFLLLGGVALIRGFSPIEIMLEE